MSGYRFLGEQCDRAGGDVAELRLLRRRTVVLRGGTARAASTGEGVTVSVVAAALAVLTAELDAAGS